MNPWGQGLASQLPWRGPTPHPLPAWLLIVLAVSAVVLLGRMERAATKPDPRAGNALVEIQAKIVFAGTSLGGVAETMDASEYADLAPTPGMAWRLAAFEAATCTNPAMVEEDLLPFIESFDDQVATLGAEAVQTHEAVKRALRDPAALDAAQSRLLEDRLGWFGRVLISHRSGSRDAMRAKAESEAQRVLWIAVGAVGAAVVALLCGFVLIIIALVQYLSPRQPLLFESPAPSAPGAIYLEATALYLTLYVGLALFGGLILGAAANPMFVGAAMLTLASLAGVVWPMVRFRDASAARRDLGLTCGRGVLREVGAGVVGYVACLPILALGIVVSMALALIHALLAKGFGWETAQGPEALHPIVEWVASGSSAQWIAALMLAAGFAPFFEEIMFRGALLSGAARSLGTSSAIFVMAFIFAVIHPQGWVGVPALMSIAIAFGLLRMWRRGCLIAPMTAHALHNGSIVTVLMLLLW